MDSDKLRAIPKVSIYGYEPARHVLEGWDFASASMKVRLFSGGGGNSTVISGGGYTRSSGGNGSAWSSSNAGPGHGGGGGGGGTWSRAYYGSVVMNQPGDVVTFVGGSC